MDLEELYQEVLLDHFKNPRCKGCVPDPDAKLTLHNPLCGDHINLTLKVKDGIVEDIAFDGHGCAISQASASMMTGLVKGKTLEEVKKSSDLFRSLMKGDAGEGEIELTDLGDAASLGGVRKFAARIKCALLAWEAIDKCLVQIGTSKKSS